MRIDDTTAAVLIWVAILGGIALAGWLSPNVLRWLAVRLNARSEALTAARSTYDSVYAAVMDLTERE